MSMIGKQLAHYEITSQLGKGGMGEVYQAKDRKLGRDAAIKVLPEEFARDADRVARFQREAKLLASLNHPNIAAIHGLEESGGTNFLVLELVEGQTLADRIKAGPIPVEESLKLAFQIAEALEAAHEKGVIHRDLKPSNIKVTPDGKVKVLDFGLAKAYAGEQADLNRSNTPTLTYSPTLSNAATQQGVILGTVAYMSPEQAQGQPADARSDIFSFGLVLYEMLNGRRAFTGDSNYAIMNAIVKEDPPQLQASPSLEKIVRRCLAKQPSGRYQTMLEIKTALEQVFGEKAIGTSAEPQPSIAVLPFVNMSGDKEQEYFSDGLAEEIINALTKIPGLKVIARTSSFAFRGKEQDITKIAEALRVSTILEGSVRKAGNRIRVTAVLIDASKGTHRWSQRYDRDLTDIFAIQDEISQAIAERMRLRLSGDRPLVKRPTENMEAYNLFLKGRFHLSKVTPEGFAKSKEYYEQAIAIDPNCAPAWSGLADLYHRMGSIGSMPQKAANAQSSRAVLKALELDEMLPEAHAMMGVLRADDFDWQGAEHEFRRALELNPKSEDATDYYIMFYLAPMQRLDEALAVCRETVKTDPLSPFLQYQLGRNYMLAQQWDRAIDQFHNALELDPHFGWSHEYLGRTYIRVGKFDEGIRACETAVQLLARIPFTLGILGWAYARAGRLGEAQRLLTELEDISRKDYVLPSSFAIIYLGLGEIDKCIDWFEKAVNERESLIAFKIADFDPLRSHPRYQALLRKMNLIDAPMAH